MSKFTVLEEIAKVSLGYKSLQNEFFYLNKATIDTFGIEKQFLRPILTFSDMDGGAYLQKPTISTWLFECKEKESDLRSTGALRYIHALADRPATDRKQSGARKTVKQALEAQGGGTWYAPKARPFPARLWLRKAVDAVFAPFIFVTPKVVDQRCNYLEPIDDLEWELLGAVMTSTLFAYSMEINGSASMGAGALEAPTSKLRRYPVFDPRTLTSAQQGELVKLGKAVWQGEAPVNWGAAKVSPGPKLRALDGWLLGKAKSGVKIEQLYADLKATCDSRIAVAQDKTKTQKKRKSASIGSVAEGIAKSLEALLNTRQFPESFYSSDADTISFHVDRGLVRRVQIAPFMDTADVTLLADGGKEIQTGNYPLPVAEAIVRAVLLGREKFAVPSDSGVAEDLVKAFLTWFDDVRIRLDVAISESALGTGYEDTLRSEVYSRLRISPVVGERVLEHDIGIAPQAV
ncbi:MAG: hypothetical protein SGI88_03600 [Candidatus Hydrogenedentes bacterium]|nr:hypothetical protein [Candidatus Hydrogenedentota bacterium]